MWVNLFFQFQIMNQQQNVDCNVGSVHWKNLTWSVYFEFILMADFWLIYPYPPMLLNLCLGKIMTHSVKKN